MSHIAIGGLRGTSPDLRGAQNKFNFGSGGRDSNPQSPGYGPGEIPFLHPALFPLFDAKPFGNPEHGLTGGAFLNVPRLAGRVACKIPATVVTVFNCPAKRSVGSYDAESSK